MTSFPTITKMISFITYFQKCKQLSTLNDQIGQKSLIFQTITEFLTATVIGLVQIVKVVQTKLIIL